MAQLKDLIVEVQDHPETIDCSAAPDFAMAKRKMGKKATELAAEATVATETDEEGGQPPSKRSKTTKGVPSFRCELMLANHTSCGRQSPARKSMPLCFDLVFVVHRFHHVNMCRPHQPSAKMWQAQGR